MKGQPLQDELTRFYFAARLAGLSWRRKVA